MCTVRDRCVAGNCTAGSQKICTALDQCHDPGTCALATGVCSNPIRDGSCSDGDRCTLSDTCLGGVCQGTPVVCTPLDQCHDAGTCIAATGACSNPPRDGPCDDGNKCTRTDMCQNGSCQGGDPVVYTPLDDCHDAGVCNPATGVCTNPVKPRCPCTRDDECDDANPCTDDSCRGGDCVHTNNSASCDDGIACTQHDVCREGSCHGTPSADLCEDHNVCTTDRCDPAHGCVRTQNTESCDDGNACTENDVCRDGSCLGTPNPGLCNDHNGCTTDRCDSALGCLHVNNADPCDDGNSCTGDGTCHDGTCTPGAALGCFVGVRCACNPGLGCGAEVVPSKVNDPFSRACGLVTTAKEITANLTIGKAQRLRMAKGKVASAGKALKASLAGVRKARVKTARTKISDGCAQALTGKISAIQVVVRKLRADFTACSADTRGPEISHAAQ